MDARGGSATVNGVLFQLLGSIHRASELYFRGSVRGDDLVSAVVVLEPKSGGDLQLDLPNKRIVEQWKSRRSGRKWTIRDVIKQVMPDLFHAVDSERLDGPCVYRFVTEGECTDWSAAQTLFQWMAETPTPDDPFSVLDHSKKQPFFPRRGDSCTASDFFRFILSEIRQKSGKPLATLDDAEIGRRLWHMLSRFEVKSVIRSELEEEIDDVLRHFVDHPGEAQEIDSKRNELCGLVLHLASRKGRRITPVEFFKMAKLNLTALGNWRYVFNRLRESWQNDLQSKLHYAPDLDVRSKPEWPQERPVLLITGESGRGKSWRLAAIGRSREDHGTCVAALRSTGNAKETLQRAADFVWKTGFARQRELSLDGVASSLKDCANGLPDTWLTILVDDVRSPQEARDLIEYPLDRFGTRLAMVVPNNMAEALQKEYAKTVEVDVLDDFKPHELRDYMKRRGYVWADLQVDLRKLLLWPLLAHLYCEIADHKSWPTNEYELFKTTWQRISTDPKQISHPDDVSHLRELVTSTLKNNNEYPWTLGKCRESGLDSDAIQRLVDIGWLERDEGRIRIWHSRLLNWAIAEALANEFHHRGASAIDLIELALTTAPSQQVPFGTQRFGYLPMDLLWLACDSDQGRPSEAKLILSAIETQRFDDLNSKGTLYKNLIPTLGKRVMRPLIAHICELNPDHDSLLCGYLTKALLKIGRQYPDDVRDCAVEMLANSCTGIQTSAIKLARRFPSVAALDPLWKLVQYLRELKDSSSAGNRNSASYHEANARSTIRRCAALAPEWIEEKIGCATDADLIGELAYALSTIDGDGADEIWQKSKRNVYTKLADGHYGLAHCIFRFADRDGIDFLETWMQAEDTRLAGVATNGLAGLAPDRAMANLGSVCRVGPNLSRWLWLRLLLEFDKNKTLGKFRELIQESVNDAVGYALAFEGQTHYLDPALFRVLLETLEALIHKRTDDAKSDERMQLLRLLQFLSTVANCNLLDEFRSFRGSTLEVSLVSAARAWVDAGPAFSFEREAAITVLARIGGSGLTEAVNSMLKSESKANCRDGLQWALFRPDAETRVLLRRIATRTDSDDESKIPPLWYLRKHAREVLALLEEDRSLVESMLVEESSIQDLVEIRDGLPAMDNESFQPALDALRSEAQEQVALALMALGATGRSDVIPRIKEVISAHPPESRIAFGGLVGLAGLRADDDETIQLFASHLSFQKHRLIAVNGLLLSDRKDARQIVLDNWQQHYEDKPFGLDERIGVLLAQFPETKDAAMRRIKRLVTRSDRFRNMFRPAEYLELLGDVDGREIDEFLIEEADPDERGSIGSGRRPVAIKALAKRDRDAAFDAASRALKSGMRNREMYPNLLVDLDAKRAIPVLCERFLSEGNQLVRRSLGLGLRHSGETESARKIASKWLGGRDIRARRIASQIAGWMGPPFLEAELRDRLGRERIDTVRHAIAHALLKFDREREAAEMLSRLPTAEGASVWCYIDVLFELVDPEFLGNNADPLWIGPAFDALPVPCRRFINQRHRERLKKIADDLRDRNH